MIPSAETATAATKQARAAHPDLGIGLADASLVVLSHELGATDLLTLDERRFRVLTGARGGAFRILPADVS